MALFSVVAGAVPANLNTAARAEFHIHIERLNQAVTSPDFILLLKDQCEQFAKAYGFRFHEATAGPIIDGAIAAHGATTFTINGRVLRGRFGQFEKRSSVAPDGRITIDTSLFTVLAERAAFGQLVDPALVLKTHFITFVKSIHEIGHAMTWQLNEWIRTIYAAPNYAKKRKFVKSVNSPERVGRIKSGKTYKGDSGNQLEQLLTNNHRVSYVHGETVNHIDEVMICTINGKTGRAVPAATITTCLNNAATFYTTFQHEFAGAAAFPLVEQASFDTRGIKCSHGWADDAIPSHIKI